MSRGRGFWEREARRILPALRAWRVAFHLEPELSNHENRTRDKVLRALGELDLPAATYADGFYGVLGRIESDRSGPVVALRADMDALPVREATGAPFASRSPGAMHACGHDVHMACLLGAAALLKRQTSRLRGPVKLLFQPAEEDGDRGGALPFLEHGAFDRPKVGFVVGQHVAPEVPLGQIGWKKGPIMAAPDRFEIRVRGTPGHASTPHQGPDAVLAAAEVVTGLQALVSRARNPVDPVVVSVGTIHGGTRHNVLPEEVVLSGTVRTVSARTRDQMESLLRRRVRGIVRSLGASARIVYRRGYPMVVNEPRATGFVTEALAEEFGSDRLFAIENPGMGGEDFSRYLERAPGTFLRLGVRTPKMTAPLHSPYFLPDESVMVMGSAALAAAAVGVQERA
jgi:amidohydrolase